MFVSNLYVFFKADEGFTNLTGVDYSEQAVELAKRVTKNKGLENITLMVIGKFICNSNDSLHHMKIFVCSHMKMILLRKF